TVSAVAVDSLRPVPHAHTSTIVGRCTRNPGEEAVGKGNGDSSMDTPGSGIVVYDDVTKQYDRPGQPPALEGITLTIRRGEIFGVIGESGAGKTTLLELINGLTAPDSGTVTVDGASVAH